MSLPEYDQCSRCAEEVTQDSDFCPHCGILLSEDESIRCDTHPLSPAIGVCIICHKLACDDDGKDVKGRFFCLGHKSVEVQQDWAKVFQSTEINDSELVKSFLETNGFKVLVQNFTPIGYVWDGGGDSSLSRSALSKPAKVFVPIPEYQKAEETIREWKSGDAASSEELLSDNIP